MPKKTKQKTIKLNRGGKGHKETDQLLCHLSDILLNTAFKLGTVVTCFSTIGRVKFFSKMNELKESSTINLIFTVANL